MGKEGGTVQVLTDIGDKKVAVIGDSISHKALQAAGAKNIIPTDSLYNAYATFIRGGADYVVGDLGVLTHHHSESGVADKIRVYTAVYDKSENVAVGYAIAKDRPEFAKKVNAGLANIRANGKYDEIYKKWFGDNESLKVPADKLQ